MSSDSSGDFGVYRSSSSIQKSLIYLNIHHTIMKLGMCLNEDIGKSST